MKQKIKRWLLMIFVCKIKGHTSNDSWYYPNGFKKGTSQTSKPVQLFQKKCDRCNRYYGEEIKNT